MYRGLPNDRRGSEPGDVKNCNQVVRVCAFVIYEVMDCIFWDWDFIGCEVMDSDLRDFFMIAFVH